MRVLCMGFFVDNVDELVYAPSWSVLCGTWARGGPTAGRSSRGRNGQHWTSHFSRRHLCGVSGCGIGGLSGS